MVACVPERVLCLIEDMCEDLYVGTLAKLDFPLRPCSRHLTKIMMTKWSRVEIFNRPQITFEPCGHSRLSSVTVSVLGMKQRCLLPIGFLMESPYVPLQAQLPLHDSRSMLWIMQQELYPNMLIVTGTTSSASPIVKTVPGRRHRRALEYGTIGYWTIGYWTIGYWTIEYGTFGFYCTLRARLRVRHQHSPH